MLTTLSWHKASNKQVVLQVFRYSQRRTALVWAENSADGKDKEHKKGFLELHFSVCIFSVVGDEEIPVLHVHFSGDETEKWSEIEE